MTNNRELAEKRIDKMGFDEQEKAVVFCSKCEYPEGDPFIDWLLTATEAEINAWFDSVNIGCNEFPKSIDILYKLFIMIISKHSKGQYDS